MSENDEVSEEDARQLAPFLIAMFGTLYVATLALNIAVVAALLYLGWTGSAWWLVVPAGAAIWFGVRVAKRWARNLLDACREQLETAQGIEPTDQERPLTTLRARARKPPSGATAVMIVVVAMLAASGLWYGIGALAKAVL